jgi:hypothetical protein
MKGITLTKEFVENHQARHGFLKAPLLSSKASEVAKVPKPRQNKTEAEYGLILEAMKRRGDIVDYRPFGIRLEWGCDPVTGKPMVYSPDFFVMRRQCTLQYAGLDDEPVSAENPVRHLIEGVIVEVKGGYIHPQDWIRFKGCRAEWPMFRFELHQKTKEGWRRLL